MLSEYLPYLSLFITAAGIVSAWAINNYKTNKNSDLIDKNSKQIGELTKSVAELTSLIKEVNTKNQFLEKKIDKNEDHDRESDKKQDELRRELYSAVEKCEAKTKSQIEAIRSKTQENSEKIARLKG